MRLGDALGAWARSADKRGGLSKARAVSLWPEIAGEEIAKHTLGVSLNQETMSVHVDSHVWAAELSLLAEELKDRLNAALGEETVRQMRFTVSRRVSDAREEREAERRVRRGYGGDSVLPAQLTASEIEAIRRSAEVIENPELREAAVRAQMRDLQVKKARQSESASQGADSDVRRGKTPDIR